MKSQLRPICLKAGTPALPFGTFRLSALIRVGICAILLISTISAEAAPLTWTLDGVTFPDGGSANGSFVFDADTNIYSNIAINTTTTTTFVGATYTDFFSYNSPGFVAVPDVSLPSLSGSLAFGIAFWEPLTNAGGNIDVFIVYEGVCRNTACELIDTIPSRTEVFPIGASVTAVPIPPALYLFGSSLLGLIGIFSRKKTA